MKDLWQQRLSLNERAVLFASVRNLFKISIERFFILFLLAQGSCCFCPIILPKIDHLKSSK